MKQSVEDNQLKHELTQIMKESIQMELKKLKNKISNYSYKVFILKSCNSKLEDKIKTINKPER